MRGREVGDAESPHLAALLEKRESLGDLVGIHQRILAEQQECIEPFRAEHGQPILSRRHDVRHAGVVHVPRMFGAPLVHELDVALRHDLQSIAQTGCLTEGGAEALLYRVAAIDG